MEVGAAETGREGGKWEKKNNKDEHERDTYTHPKREKRKIHSFVGGMKRSLSRGIIHTLFHPFIQRSRSVSLSGSAGRSHARARARSLSLVSLSRLVTTALLVALACACRPWHQKALRQSVMER